ncbi:unnamed protein product [Fusarium graminearum]|nr:unnamed protein product [Fusarium graminearum]CAG1969757.1 unnamed protein product [Fusarium graminearum]CAG2001891.1 unnamed protein product [Fusarium graminearum]VTO93674.1 unnamed protein product [Fusarium graminearum]
MKVGVERDTFTALLRRVRLSMALAVMRMSGLLGLILPMLQGQKWEVFHMDRRFIDAIEMAILL